MSISWLFDGCKAEPYGYLPIGNLTTKGSTSIRNYTHVASYSWLCDESLKAPTIVVPGAPCQMVSWEGGQLPIDSDPILFYPDHVGMPESPLDPMIRAVREQSTIDGLPEPNFQDYDVITDCLNLQKLFAFCKGEGEGLFRVDVERIGKTLYLTRVEGSDWMPIEFETYDGGLKKQCCQPLNDLSKGPFMQISSYEFGKLKLLVRFPVDGVNYSEKIREEQGEVPEMSAAKEFEGNRKELFSSVRQDLAQTCRSSAGEKKGPERGSRLQYLSYGKKPKPQKHHLVNVTTHPAGKGYPLFTWAQMYFSGADEMLVGWYKGSGDFTRPASYSLSDINKLIKPLPYATLAKQHDVITKLTNFMRKWEDGAKVALVWQGTENLELYECAGEAPGGISNEIRQYLEAQVETNSS